MGAPFREVDPFNHQAIRRQQEIQIQEMKRRIELESYNTVCDLSGISSVNPSNWSTSLTPMKQEKKGMFTEIARDIKGFILEYRGVLYFLAAALIVDQFIFKGSFRSRLQSMADKIVAKVEAKIAS